jgi:hypothetical protein
MRICRTNSPKFTSPDRGRGRLAAAIVSAHPSPPITTPRSLVLATDIDVLAIDHTVTRRDGYLVVR